MALLLPPSLVDVFIELLRPITRVCVCVMRARLVAERVRLLTESDILLLFSQLVTAPYLNRQKCRSHPLRGETSFLVRMMDVEASETILLSNLYHVELLDSWGSFELFSLVHIFLSLLLFCFFFNPFFFFLFVASDTFTIFLVSK
jgi:hypothetical protein